MVIELASRAFDIRKGEIVLYLVVCFVISAYAAAFLPGALGAIVALPAIVGCWIFGVTLDLGRVPKNTNTPDRSERTDSDRH